MPYPLFSQAAAKSKALPAVSKGQDQGAGKEISR